MSTFDYTAPAELFGTTTRFKSKRPMSYRRFATSAEAIQFAIEEIPVALQLGTVLEVYDERFEGAQIRELYESDLYPLERRPT